MTATLSQTTEVTIYTQQEVDAITGDLQARVAALEAGGAVTLAPIAYTLFGPVQGKGAIVQAVSPAWQFPGSALTASTERFYFDRGFPRATYARWQAVWATASANLVMRLVHMDDGPQNITEIARFQGDGQGLPVPVAADVTVAFNTLVDGGVLKNLGIQFYGDGVSQMTLYKSNLLVSW